VKAAGKLSLAKSTLTVATVLTQLRVAKPTKRSVSMLDESGSPRLSAREDCSTAQPGGASRRSAESD